MWNFHRHPGPHGGFQLTPVFRTLGYPFWSFGGHEVDMFLCFQDDLGDDDPTPSVFVVVASKLPPLDRSSFHDLTLALELLCDTRSGLTKNYAEKTNCKKKD